MMCIRKVISYNSQGRDHAIDLIISAIKRAIQYCPTIKAKQSAPEEKHQKEEVHETDAADTDGLVSQLKQTVVAVFGSARAAFDAHSKDGLLGKKEFRKLIKKVLPSLEPDEAKRLRKGLPNKMTSLDFCSFIDGPEDAASSTSKAKAGKHAKDEVSGLAALPPEVPEVCQKCSSFVFTLTGTVASCPPASDLVSTPKISY